jgi:hypothetical protein
MGLSKFNLDITFATNTESDLNFHLFKNLLNANIKVINLNKLTSNFDLIIASQPYPNHYLCILYPNTPKISIIHSALRSEDAIIHSSIKHYIAVQPDIYRCLKNQYNIKTQNISLYYNPIDDTRFYKFPQHKNNVNGILIGEINDSLRTQMINHIVKECIKDDMELTIISRSKYDFKHELIKVVDPCYNTENYIKNADFTVGIGGRTTIEGWMCGLPSYIYKVNSEGDILDIQLKYPPKIERFKRDFVAKQHLELYNKILSYE